MPKRRFLAEHLCSERHGLRISNARGEICFDMNAVLNTPPLAGGAGQHRAGVGARQSQPSAECDYTGGPTIAGARQPNDGAGVAQGTQNL
jgi:hypothetical protein